jgi:hypothetical protein
MKVFSNEKRSRLLVHSVGDEEEKKSSNIYTKVRAKKVEHCKFEIKLVFVVCCGSTVAERSPHHLKVEGLSPVPFGFIAKGKSGIFEHIY